jgi:hypothetical protein
MFVIVPGDIMSDVGALGEAKPAAPTSGDSA